MAAEFSAQGWQLVSDDIVPLESGSLKAPPVPFRPSLEAAAVHRLGCRTVRYRPIGAADFSGRARRPTLLIFPRFVPDAPASRTTLPPLEVLARLTEDGSWIDLEPKRLELFLDWLATTPAYAITYPSTAAASAALAEMLSADQRRQAPAVSAPSR